MLTGVAYRILGHLGDAEDVVQEAWLRWTASDRASVSEPRAYLVRVVSRLAVDRLRREIATGELRRAVAARTGAHGTRRR